MVSDFPLMIWNLKMLYVKKKQQKKEKRGKCCIVQQQQFLEGVVAPPCKRADIWTLKSSIPDLQCILCLSHLLMPLSMFHMTLPQYLSHGYV